MIELGKKTTVIVDIPVTAENLQAYVLDKDQSIKKYDIIQGITKAHLAEYYAAETEVSNFIGAVELTQAETEGLVPVSFPHSSISLDSEITGVQFDAEGNELELTRQMNWIEYCGLIHNRQKFLPKSINGKFLCGIGRRDVNGNKKVTSNDEFRLFAGNFGIENILTKSETAILDQRTAIKTFRGTTSQELIDAMTHAELNALVVDIEIMTGLDLITAGKTKENKILEINSKLGIV